MSNTLDLRLERFKRLRQHPEDVWQGAIVRLPQWFEEGDGPPFRPLLPLWVSLETGRISVPDIALPDEIDEAAALDALFKFADGKFAGYRPIRLEVSDERLGEMLRAPMERAGIAVQVVDRLEAVDSVMQTMAEEMGGPLAMSDPLRERGVDLPRFRAFADAAATFHRAALWNHLSDQDQVHVESPTPDPDLSWFAVLGAGGETFGLGFFGSALDQEHLHEMDDPQPHLSLKKPWSLMYEPISGIPLLDADLWEIHGLPLAGREAYPLFLRFLSGGKFQRPDGPRVTFLEGLLRALSATSEDEIDMGRWTKEVSTFDGPATVRLSIPSLLDAHEPSRDAVDSIGLPDRRMMERTHFAISKLLASHQFDSIEETNRFLNEELTKGQPALPPPETPAERAQALVFEALEATGRRRIKLAREALRIHADCAEAYVLQAEEMPDLERRTVLYRMGMEAGERDLGATRFEETVGHFWGVVETRAYMRARDGYADCLIEADRLDEAVGHWRELVRLNPNDNQGVRFNLLPALLRQGRDADAEEILGQFQDDASANMSYLRALVEFRKAGPSGEARACLETALRRNLFVPKYLLAKDALPDELPEYFRFGEETEAIVCAAEIIEAWSETPGAVAWLGDADRERRKKAAARRSKKKKSRRR